MMMNRVTIIIIIVIFSNTCAQTVPPDIVDESGDFYIDQSKWVDPGDMLNFDFSSVAQKEERSTQTTSQCECPVDQKFDAPDVDCSKTKEKLKQCKKDLTNMSRILRHSEGNPKTDAFFKRLVVVLSNKIRDLRLDNSLSPQFTLEFDLSQKFVDRTDQLLSKDLSDQTPVSLIVDDVSDILIPMIQKAYPREQLSFWVRNFDLFVMSIGTVILMLIIRLLLQRRYSVILSLLLLVSVAWEWRRLYEEEVIKKEVTMIKGMSSCNSPGLFSSFLAGIKSLVVFDPAKPSDPCHEYYASLGVTTILRVNPILAFTNVFGMIFGGSFAILSDYAGKSTSNFFYHVPILLTPLVGIAVTLILVIIVTFSFGYDVRSPFLSLTRNRVNDSTLRLQGSEHRLHSNVTTKAIFPPGVSHRVTSSNQSKNHVKTTAVSPMRRTQSLIRLPTKT